MNTWLILGASLAAILAIAHSYLGERYILIPLLAMDLSPALRRERFQKSILRFAWHLTSVAWIGLGAVLLGVHRPDAAAFIGIAVAITFAIHGLVTLGASRGKHLAWPLFLLLAFGAYWGTRG